MAAEENMVIKRSSSLQRLLASIKQHRERDSKRSSSNSSEDGFVVVNSSKETFWTRIFSQHFLEGGGDGNDARDDMMFYVKKNLGGKSRLTAQADIDVYRKDSKKLPTLGDPAIDWEETVYLNVILHQIEYQLTCAVCSRTGDKELQILKKISQKVYASPSRRQMESKGTEEIMTYPDIFFMIDDFEEIFSDIIIRDSEMVCVELVASDRMGEHHGVIFLGSVRYDALRRVYDTRASLSHRMASSMSLGLFSGNRRVEFLKMRGPGSKGFAEMAVSRVQGTGVDTPASTPDSENFPENGFEEAPNPPQRRMSDPSQAIQWVKSSFRRGMKKSQSAQENVDDVSSNNCQEVEASNLLDELTKPDNYGFIGKSFGQAWHWFKERRRATSPALNAYLTYVTLPWHLIIADVLEPRQQPVLTF
ncbi:uncharacterized protein KIAA0930 homolog isoform X3 [Lingula anatina]|uniref:Uncharacterized protein KIAA0930 homolog isoform X3 n=1 Tax=Lingula anatina TaxID=7574 RepID=A0A1S3IV47_LINAN|nr:uncharacterized protein KIAA0930 homolog isoform X3 [Lingula anatina]|eukprot:XP_013401419.1 uncharacterized protein KIAA0930 homolog isoform X3 [Lingula anatina]